MAHYLVFSAENETLEKLPGTDFSRNELLYFFYGRNFIYKDVSRFELRQSAVRYSCVFCCNRRGFAENVDRLRDIFIIITRSPVICTNITSENKSMKATVNLFKYGAKHHEHRAVDKFKFTVIISLV